MEKCWVRILGVALLAGVVVVAGCKQKQPAPQAEKMDEVTTEVESALDVEAADEAVEMAEEAADEAVEMAEESAEEAVEIAEEAVEVADEAVAEKAEKVKLPAAPEDK